MPRYVKFKRPNTDLTKIKDIVVITLPTCMDTKVKLHASVLMGNSQFNQDRVQKYFRHELGMDEYPFHQALEYIGADYHAFMLEPTYTRSTFLEELVSYDIIPYRYRDAICVCIYEDFNADQPDDRMYDVLAYRILSPLMKQHSISKENVKFLDEIIVRSNPTDTSRYMVGFSENFSLQDLRSALVKYHT
jgi:hypothetical protein